MAFGATGIAKMLTLTLFPPRPLYESRATICSQSVLLWLDVACVNRLTVPLAAGHFCHPPRTATVADYRPTCVTDWRYDFPSRLCAGLEDKSRPAFQPMF